MDTVRDGTWAASSTQWFSVTLMGNRSQVNSANLTYTTSQFWRELHVYAVNPGGQTHYKVVRACVHV